MDDFIILQFTEAGDSFFMKMSASNMVNALLMTFIVWCAFKAAWRWWHTDRLLRRSAQCQNESPANSVSTAYSITEIGR